MQAGYDYLLLRGRNRYRAVIYAGVALLALGAMLAVGGLMFYQFRASPEELQNLQVTAPPSPAAPTATPAPPPAADPPAPPATPAPRTVPGFSPEAIAAVAPYPGAGAGPDGWNARYAYLPPHHQEQLLLQGMAPIDGRGMNAAAQPATRLAVPAVGIDSAVAELDILEEDGARVYERPSRVVGHLPESAEAGQAGDAWFFGHTESPLLGEGSVFFRLREVPDLLRQGRAVNIITENAQERFVYRVTGTRVVHEDELQGGADWDAGEVGPTFRAGGRATIHLVACVPRLVYDHRLIVDGTLVGQMRLAP